LIKFMKVVPVIQKMQELFSKFFPQVIEISITKINLDIRFD